MWLADCVTQASIFEHSWDIFPTGTTRHTFDVRKHLLVVSSIVLPAWYEMKWEHSWDDSVSQRSTASSQVKWSTSQVKSMIQVKSSQGFKANKSTCFWSFSNHVFSHIFWTIWWIKLKLSEHFFLFAYLIVQFLFSLPDLRNRIYFSLSL